MILVFRTFQMPGWNSVVQPFAKFMVIGSVSGPVVTDVQRVWAFSNIKHPL